MLFPAHAGVILRRIKMYPKRFTFPRTRGGDPTSPRRVCNGFNFSPHTRG